MKPRTNSIKNLLSKAVATTVRLPSCGLWGGFTSGDVASRVESVPRWNDEVLEASKLVSPNEEAFEAENWKKLFHFILYGFM